MTKALNAQQAAEILKTSRVYVSTNMGSCQCGDTDGYIEVVDGSLVAHIYGRYNWQCYDGPATECKVAYGLGDTVKAIACAFLGIEIPHPYAFTQGSTALIYTNKTQEVQ